LCHFIKDDKYLFNWKPINDVVVVGDWTTQIATKEGSLYQHVLQNNGAKCHIVLHGFKYISGINTSLFSITTALAKGWHLSNCYRFFRRSSLF
jgi:hypothetical protein